MLQAVLMILHNAMICSVLEQPFLKPACSTRKVWSTASCSLLNNTLVKTLPDIDNQVITSSCCSYWGCPSWTALQWSLLFQASGTSTSCQILLHRTSSCPVMMLLPLLSISAEISSMSDVLLLVKLWIVWVTCAALMHDVLTSHCSLGHCSQEQLSRGFWLVYNTIQYNTIQWIFPERRDVYAGWVQRRLGRLRYVLRVKGSCEQCCGFSLDLKMAKLSLWRT